MCGVACALNMKNQDENNNNNNNKGAEKEKCGLHTGST